MAVVLMDGFDTYSGVAVNTGLQSKWTLAASTSAQSTMVAGRFGGQAFRHSNTNNGTINHLAHRNLPSALSAGAIGFAFRAPGSLTTMLGLSGWIFYLLEGSVYHLALSVDASTGAIRVHRNTSHTAGTLLGTSANGVIVANTWHFIEIEFVINDTTGVVNLYVDDVLRISLSGQDTRNAGTGVIDRIASGAYTANSSFTQDIDDLYVDDTGGRLGDHRIETLYPNGDVAQGFSRSSGSTNYTLVDEAQVNGDTDYVQASNIGDVDSYDFGNLSSAPIVKAIQMTAYALKTDAGSRSIALQVKSGAATDDGPNFSLSASYGRLERILLTDPDTGSAWSINAVNALRGGPKVTV